METDEEKLKKCLELLPKYEEQEAMLRSALEKLQASRPNWVEEAYNFAVRCFEQEITRVHWEIEACYMLVGTPNEVPQMRVRLRQTKKDDVSPEGGLQ
jgi:hypothetical protein